MKKATTSFVFSMTAGRTGTEFLAELLRRNLADAKVSHEILGYSAFGVDTPDVSHLTLFNSQGNVDKVRLFWGQKFERIQNCNATHYVETSHILLKAGLVENIHRLPEDVRIYFIVQRRDPVKTVMSYRNRYDFTNIGNMWMWYLDPGYPRNLVDAEPYLGFGVEGLCLWYLSEIETRTEFYRLKLSGDERVVFLDIDLEELNQEKYVEKLVLDIGAQRASNRIILPARANKGPTPIQFPDNYAESLRALMRKLGVNAKERAEWAFTNGKGFNPSR